MRFDELNKFTFEILNYTKHSLYIIKNILERNSKGWQKLLLISTKFCYIYIISYIYNEID